jgi:bleomycin hydrolase
MPRRNSFIRCLGCAVLAAWLVAPARAQTTQEELRAALDKLPHPKAVAECQTVASLPCLNQGNTFICWSFATCSFLESEMTRLKLPSVRLSVMYPVYCQYLDKARRFVQTKGESRFSPGDTFCGVLDTCHDYGAMPASAYDGPSDGRELNQRSLYAELEGYVAEVKSRGEWDEAKS